MARKVTKAVFPVAGLGTRFLPATKSIPKEIMTLVDRPLIQYAVDEARAAGIEEFVFVTSRGKGALEDYFDRSPVLEAALRVSGDARLLRELEGTTMPSGAIAYVRQHRPLGLGHAVWCARRLVAPGEAFAVILPDDVIAAETPCLEQMVAAHRATGGTMVAAAEVPSGMAHAYGMLEVEETGAPAVRVTGMVEKPGEWPLPSGLAAVGRYILAPRILRHLGELNASAAGELQLTDAIAAEIGRGGRVSAFRFSGERFDCGSKAGFLKAAVALGLRRDDLREELLAFLADAAAPGPDM